MREQLVSLATGADATEPALGRVFVVRDLDPASDLQARSLWDAAALAADCRASLADLRASEARLERLSDEEAMVESFLVGGRILRQLVRHPLLPPDEVVPNDVRLGEGFHVLVISGPNAGGKTVAMKALALCALFARAGLFVPAAEGARMSEVTT